jgi:hypothetical protein
MRKLLVLFLSIFFIVGCQQSPSPSPHKPLKKGEEIKTRATLFMYFDSIPDNLRTVYIRTQNNSGTDAFTLRPYLVQALKERGYTIVNHVSQANLVVRANQFRVGTFPSDKAKEIMQTDFGNSTQAIKLPTEPPAQALNYAIIVDMQVFQRVKLIDPLLAPKTEMSESIELITLNNISTWEHSQTRIITEALHIIQSQDIILNELGYEISTATKNVIRN